MTSRPRPRIPPVPALLVAGFSLQGGAALAKQLFPALGPAGASGMVVAAAVVLPFALASGAATKMTPTLAVIGLGVAILASALPYSLEMVALHALPSRVFGILTSLEPVVATLVGWVALGEALAGKQWLAVGLVCAASVGATLSARNPTPTPASSST